MRGRGKMIALVVAAAALVPAASRADDPLANPRDFAQPPNDVRPKMRWWWATPYDDKEAADELNAMAQAGFGGAEAAFNTDGWGGADQRKMLVTALQTARSDGMRLDMTLGASWPVTTPNTKPGSGLSEQELMYGRRDLTGPSSYMGPAPTALDDQTGQQRGGKLVAVTAAKVLTEGPPATPVGGVPFVSGGAPASSPIWLAST